MVFVVLRGHSTTTWTEFCYFLTPPEWTVFIPWAWTKIDIFYPLPPHLVHVVIEWPPNEISQKKNSKSQDTRSSLEKLKLRPFDIFWSTMLDVKRCPVHKIGIPAQITLISECWIGTKVLGNSHWIYPPSIFWFGLAPTLHHQLGRAEQSQWVFGNLFDLEQLFFPLFLGSFSRSWADRNLPVGCSKMQKNHIWLCAT